MSPPHAPVLGPFYSHWGFKNWLLHLHPTHIEAEPLGIWISIKGGALGSTGSQAAAQAAYAPDSNPSSLVRRESSRHWAVDDLEKIEVRRQLFTANEVRLSWRDGRTLLLALGFRRSTDAVRQALRASYPALYAERRFKA
ncbi:hypothetical protein [Pseudoxanthomonas sp. Root630]|uniref:hypothetical protein n=1 Tax=Pseudoxanthomonas sp. Root630 TaxID=1736574 RepID=UPI0007025F71|nr:hypothetical protein [Pseudoxanthomonas sp. Root630]KRA45351.1 hypothetical protein ASD72_08925 [Pseudoxanthomonas sp. Root630]